MLLSMPGQQQCELSLLPNVSEGELFSNIEVNSARGLPMIDRALEGTDIPAAIVGGGPSLTSTLEKIREAKSLGCKIFALNNVAKYLAEHGIRADYQVIIDSRQMDEQFVMDRHADEALLSSQCHPLVVDRCLNSGYPLRIFHPAIPDIEKYSGNPAPFAIWSGWTVGLTAMSVVHTLGHREIHLFGYDSCHSEDGKSHAYPQPMNDTEEMLKVAIDNRIFNCSVAMAAQAAHFEEVATMLTNHGANISVHGDGLVPFIAYKMTHKSDALLAVYDLGASPPTYDFLAFLSQAEIAREKAGHQHLDIAFMPGPRDGFRNDDLPPDRWEREAMLWRVCVGLTRCVPSIRNVQIFRERQDLKADFPAGWENVRPLRHYGSHYLKDAPPILRATEAGKRSANRICGGAPYATITLRQSGYHEWRNSNPDTWSWVANWLEDKGNKVILIPDTNGHALDGHTMCWEAAFDVDLRLALYEGAAFNAGIVNGPTSMLCMQKAPWIVFLPYDEGHTSEPITLYSYGVKDHEERYGSGFFVWGGDSLERVSERLPVLYDNLTSLTAKG